MPRNPTGAHHRVSGQQATRQVTGGGFESRAQAMPALEGRQGDNIDKETDYFFVSLSSPLGQLTQRETRLGYCPLVSLSPCLPFMSRFAACGESGLDGWKEMGAMLLGPNRRHVDT